MSPASSVATLPRANWSEPSPVERGHVWTAPANELSFASRAACMLINPAP
jgi:hypothetical protein